MLETMNKQNHAPGFYRVSQYTCEVSQFMKNFFEAVDEGNSEEIETYYADDVKPLTFPVHTRFKDEIVAADDHIATFSCSIGKNQGNNERLVCVLDKSEGYWQIIHGQIQREIQHH